MTLVLASTTATDAVLIVCALALLAAFLWGRNRWTNGKRWYAEQSSRPAPVEPNGFIEHRRDHERLMQRRRDGLAVHAELAREDLALVEARELRVVV